MTATLTVDTDADDFLAEFGILIGKGYGLDRSWVLDGACVRYMASAPESQMNPWVADWWKMYGDVRGRELVRAALIICHDCPAQYDCARYGVKADVRAGTYAMTLVDMRWLQGEDDWEDIIDSAEANGVAMSDTIVVLRPRV